MRECPNIAQAPLTVNRKGLPEHRRLLKATGGSLVVHIALFAVVIFWSGGDRLVSPPARVITVDMRELELPAEQAGAPVRVSAPGPVRVTQPRPVQTIVQPAPARTVAQQAPAPVATAAPPAQAPVMLPAPTPAPAAVSSPPQAGGAAQSARSAESAGVASGEPPRTFPASVLPAGSARGVSAPPPTAAAESRGGGKFFDLCRGLIERNKDYPVMARRGRMEGTVMVRCVLARDGSIRQSGMVRSSGSSLLDNAAVRAVRRVGQFPPLPPNLQGEEFAFEVPITFRLSAQ